MNKRNEVNRGGVLSNRAASTPLKDSAVGLVQTIVCTPRSGLLPQRELFVYTWHATHIFPSEMSRRSDIVITNNIYHCLTARAAFVLTGSSSAQAAAGFQGFRIGRKRIAEWLAKWIPERA